MLSAGLIAVVAPGRAEPALRRDLQLEVFLNGKTTTLVGAFVLFPDGRLAAERKELREVGINPPGAGSDEDLIALDDIADLTFTYDEPRQRLDVTLGLERRMPHTIDVRGPVEGPGAPQTGWGAVLNYGLLATGTSRFEPSRFEFSGVSAQLQGRAFTPYGQVTQTAILGSTLRSDVDALRLDTTFGYSDPETAVSYRAGDVITRGPAWVRPIRIGGLQAERNFGLRPDLITAPLPQASGSAAVPSTVDVFVNNVRTFSQEVPAGPYRVTNIPAISGVGTARVVLRDVSGREVETALPFFASSTLLREGLYDFAVQAGVPRLGYAVRSALYAESMVGVGSLRYGLTDTLTLEAHAEGGAGLANGGVGLVTNAGAFGVLSAAARMSERFGAVGYQAHLGFETSFWGMTVGWNSQRSFGAFEDLASATARFDPSDFVTERRGLARHFVDDDALTTGSLAPGLRPERALDRVSVGIPLPVSGATLSVSALSARHDGGERARIVSASLSQTLWQTASLSLTAFAGLDHRRERGAFFGFSMPLGIAGAHTTAGAVSNNTGSYATLEAYRPLGAEVGSTGWRIRTVEGQGDGYRSAAGSYRSSIGRLEASVEQAHRGARVMLDAEGALVAVDGDVALGNRIDDAFALVDVGEPGVEVFHQNRSLGRTGWTGKVVAPSLVPYQRNKIAIDPGSLPLDARVARTSETVTPAGLSGVRIDFGVQARSNAAVVIFQDADGRPLRAGLRGRLEGRKAEFLVGYDGRAYIDELGPSNTALIESGDGGCRAVFTYAPADDTQLVIGPVPCIR